MYPAKPIDGSNLAKESCWHYPSPNSGHQGDDGEGHMTQIRPQYFLSIPPNSCRLVKSTFPKLYRSPLFLSKAEPGAQISTHRVI